MEEKAHAYVDLGLRVLPIKPGTKVPLTRHGAKDATDDHAQIHQWWERWPTANIGIATGTKIDVIDLDGWKAQECFAEIQDHPEILGAVMTPRDGGMHLYVSATGKGNRAGVLPGIDYRGSGGYVLAPPSVIVPDQDHDYGGEYEWIDDLDLSRWTDHDPSWLPEKTIERAPINGAPHSIELDDDHLKGYLESAIKLEINNVSLAQKGQRNHVLNAAGFSLGQLTPHLLDDHAIVDALAPAARSVGLSDAEIAKTLDHAIGDGARQPRWPELRDQGWSCEDVSYDQWVADHGDHGLGDADELIFWQARPELDHLRRFALARLCSPWAVLGVVIMRVLTSVPPWVMLPPLIGGKGNLNAFCSLVGPSGTGKDAAVRCATDAVKIMQHDQEYKIKMVPVGTGEGMLDQFATIEKGEQIARDDQRVLFTGLEVNMIKALTSRSGSTLIEILKMAFSGSQIGFTYRNKGQGSVILEADQYRLCMIIGAQPENIEPLMNDDLGGFPQRLLWLPSTDETISADHDPEPEPWLVPDQKWIGMHVDLAVPDEIKMIIVDERVKRMSGHYDGDLDGHYRYVQLKVAAGLMILAGRRIMIMDDWHLADMIMKKSIATRDSAMRTIKRKHDQKREAEHADAARRAVVIKKAELDEDEKHDAVIMAQMKSKIMSMLKDGAQRKRDVDRRYQSALVYKACVQELIDEGVVIKERDGQRGVWLRLT